MVRGAIHERSRAWERGGMGQSGGVGIEAHSVVSRWLVLGLSVVASVIFLGDPGSWT